MQVMQVTKVTKVMKKATSIGRFALLLALAGAISAPLGCSRPLEVGRRDPPAPQFDYVTDEQLESAMWRLAAGITSLNEILEPARSVSSSQRLEVIRILDRMIAAVDELGPKGASANHPRVARNLGGFREKLAIARSSVSMEPPRYYLVGSMSGTCLACHASE
jgi:hypothetical protein